MNVPSSQVRVESQPTYDLKLSELYRWQAALNVPTTDLLMEPDSGLSPSIALRGQLLKAMKTLRSIQVCVHDEALQSLTQMLAQQLTDMMPELSQVPAWPLQGRQRTNNELGAIADKPLPDDFFDYPFNL